MCLIADVYEIVNKIRSFALEFTIQLQAFDAFAYTSVAHVSNVG